MKRAISSVWLIGLVTLFILLFSGYLAVTINYSRAIKVKNQLLTIVEKQKCVIDDPNASTKTSIVNGSTVYGDIGSLQLMSLYLYGAGYKTKGSCGDTIYPLDGTNKWYGITDLGIGGTPASTQIKTKYEEVKTKSKKYYFCVLKIMDKTAGSKTVAAGYFYYIQVFYRIDLPVLGDIFTFGIAGNTAKIYGGAQKAGGTEICPSSATIVS